MMKRITAVLAVLLMTVLSASAQKKIWTWNANDPTRFRMMESVAMNEDGSGAFAMKERYSEGPYRSHLLVWVDRNGKVLMKQRINHPQKEWSYSHGIGYWQLYFSGKNNLIVYYGVGEKRRLLLYQAKKDKASFVKALPVQRVWTFSDNSFQGWTEMKGKDFFLKGHPAIGDQMSWDYQHEESDMTIPNMDTLTAWKF